MAKRKHPFTPEQIIALEQNKFTHSVTPDSLVFTLEFKKYFVDQTRNYGKTGPSILREAGYDTSWFSKTNLKRIRQRILAEADSPSGLKSPRGLSPEERIDAFEAKSFQNQQTNESIKELKEHIVYLEKQIEFLKKISFIRSSNQGTQEKQDKSSH